ncbi:uncharacterized protein LOC115371997 isoform X1 [Myripristis murdjan]|uniref:uncharacterized protein LOC115371997 isoform X1 n=1 Tax=Myripristis murdjan TaxID=586833 RepID=UPI001175F371|nr:uncharacterized protein LOC115371997 isoform X1 [Myripristis murdjan]
MPSQGSTMKTCVVCRTQLYVACKTCKTCKAEQPHKLRLKRKMEKFDQKRDSWVSSNLRNRTTSHIRDQAHILLEKLQSLGVRAVVFMSKPRKKPNAWVSEVLAPRCQLTETSTACLDKMKELYDFVIQGWTPQGAAGKPDEALSAPARPPMVPPDPQAEASRLRPSAAPTRPATARRARQAAASSTVQPARPRACQTFPHSQGLPAASPVSSTKEEAVDEGRPAAGAVLPRKRKVLPQQLLVIKEEVPPELQEQTPSQDPEEPELPHIKEEKEEKEEVWAQLQDFDTTEFPFTAVAVKSEDEEEKAQPSLLHPSRSEENREAEPVASSSTEQMETETGGERAFTAS